MSEQMGLYDDEETAPQYVEMEDDDSLYVLAKI